MPLFTRVLTTTFILSLATVDPTMAADAPTHYNQIHFQVERSRPIDNDRMQAVLSVTAEDDNAARLAERVNRDMGWAIKTAKAKAKIETRSSGYRTDPIYDKEKIRRWRATQALNLEGTDFSELGNLIGLLQERLQVTAISFSVSPERQRMVEDELIMQALDAFKQRAELVRKQFSAKGYRIVDVSINTGGAQPLPMMHTEIMRASSISPPALEAGTSTLSIHVGGTIELQ